MIVLPASLGLVRPAGGGGGGGSALSAAILARSPWFYYKLDEASGSTAADASGNGRHGTYAGSGTTYAQPGLFGGSANSINLSGAGAVFAPTHSTLGVNAPYSVLAFVKTTSSGAVRAILSADNTGASRRFEFRMETTGKFSFLNFGSGHLTTSVASINDGNAHMVAAVVDPSLSAADGRVKLYFDGAEDRRSTASLVFSPDNAELAVGSLSNSTVHYPWSGGIDEAAFFTTPLTAADISAIWDARNG